MINKYLIWAIALIISGAAFCLLLAREILRKIEFNRKGRIHIGEIIRTERYQTNNRDGTSATYECPIVRVRDGHNEETFRIATSGAYTSYSIGSEVRVVSSKRGLSDARIETFFESWFAAGSFGFIGIAALGGGVAILLLYGG